MRSAYLPHERIQTFPVGPTMTQQSMQDECDINNILQKYQKTGLVSHLAAHQGEYSMMPTLPEFSDAMNLITGANTMFEELPSSIREKFQNSPGKFLDFLSNPVNRQEAIEMGFIDPPAEPPPVEVPPAAPPPQDAPESAPASTAEPPAGIPPKFE